jgi:hypothetical protein
MEAPHHALLTIRALAERPVRDHWLLPTVTLGGDANRWVPWGNALPTPRGAMVYTSFPPAGFLVPFAAFSALGVPPSLQALAWFNVGLGFVSTLLLYGLLIRVLTLAGHAPRPATLAATFGTLVAVFSREALHATGVAYWSQALYQPVLLLSVHVALGPVAFARPWRRRDVLALCALVFIGTLIEWTGAVFAAGLTALLWLRPASHGRRIAIAVGVSSVAALAATAAHFVAALGARPLLTVAAFRWRDRRTGADLEQWLALLQGYWLSFGLFLAIAAVAVVWHLYIRTRATGRRASTPWRSLSLPSHPLALVAVLALLPLAENLLLAQHAGEFTFDRYKATLPLALCIAFAFVRASSLGRPLLGALLLVASADGIRAYTDNLRDHRRWREVDLANREIARRVRELSTDCTTLVSNVAVRGYPVLLFSRNLHETHRPDTLFGVGGPARRCPVILVTGDEAQKDMPHFTAIWMADANGAMQLVHGTAEPRPF